MARSKRKKKTVAKNILGTIEFEECPYHKAMTWEVYSAFKAFGENLPVVQIRWKQDGRSGNTFTFPGLDKKQAAELIPMLQKFIDGE